MKPEDLIKGMKPLIEMVGNTAVIAESIQIHYIRTIAKLTSKTEAEITQELVEVQNEQKKRISDKIIDSRD